MIDSEFVEILNSTSYLALKQLQQQFIKLLHRRFFMKSVLILILFIINATNAFASEVFVRSDIPSSVGDMEKQPYQTHKYRGSLYGYLHYYNDKEGSFALLKFSDGTKGANTVRATLVCKDSTGEIVGALPIENWMGPSHRVMVHRYYYKVNCPGNWGVAWNNHTNYFDPASLDAEKIKEIIALVKIWL